jgi:nitrite reductase (cytochrome c-552)
MDRAENSVVELIKAIEDSQKAGTPPEKLEKAKDFQRKAQWRLDFVAAENSMGFHAPQETARILGESIDYARQGQIEVLKIK